MMTIMAFIALLVSHAGGDPGSLGPINPGTGPSDGSRICGELALNADGTYENAYCWGPEGLVPPDYGAFAECYSGPLEVCAAVFDLTTINHEINLMDVYLWEDEDGVPGNVLRLEASADPGPIAMWPDVSRHLIEFSEPCCVPEHWRVGYWLIPGGWPYPWFVGADLDGPGGCPMTNIAPGQGFPSGWQDVSVAWEPTQAIGIGAEVNPCEPTLTREATWSKVKALYR